MKTIICDIDGTIFKYRPFEAYEHHPAELTPGALEKLQEMYGAGHKVILTTARPEYLRDFTVTELLDHGIPWHQLVMGIGRGPRHLLNDMSPSKPGPRATAWNLKRDEGLLDVTVVPSEDR